MEKKSVKLGVYWERMRKNRDFVGAFIADPEAALVRYGLNIGDTQFLELAELADRLFEHASKAFGDIRANNNCDDHCPQHCRSFEQVIDTRTR